MQAGLWKFLKLSRIAFLHLHSKKLEPSNYRKVDAHKAAGFFQSLQLIVPQIPGMIAQAVGAGMGCDNGFAAVLHDIPEAIGEIYLEWKS